MTKIVRALMLTFNQYNKVHSQSEEEILLPPVQISAHLFREVQGKSSFLLFAASALIAIRCFGLLTWLLFPFFCVSRAGGEAKSPFFFFFSFEKKNAIRPRGLKRWSNRATPVSLYYYNILRTSSGDTSHSGHENSYAYWSHYFSQ